MARYSEKAFAALTAQAERLVRDDIANLAQELSESLNESIDLDAAEAEHFRRVGGNGNLSAYAACLVARENRVQS